VRYALIVLGSSRSNRTGAYSISRACRRIVAHAARLGEIRAPELVIFSGWAPNGGASEAEQMRALWRGPNVELVLEPTASTTAENAARTLPLMLDRGIEQVVVVCTPFHIYRARWFFEQLYSRYGIATRFEAPRVVPTPSALIWELGALTARGRHLRAAEAELERERMRP
jgi:uncharacterized SAM-binding protein YcdF (DUF218 family)